MTSLAWSYLAVRGGKVTSLVWSYLAVRGALLRVLASLLLVRPHTNQYVCTFCAEALKTKSPATHMDSVHVPSSLSCATCD